MSFLFALFMLVAVACGLWRFFHAASAPEGSPCTVSHEESLCSALPLDHEDDDEPQRMDGGGGNGRDKIVPLTGAVIVSGQGVLRAQPADITGQGMVTAV